jgi:glycosyltransferase involved in cell wall biosynthesis
LPEIAGEAALFFDPLDVDGMCDALRRIVRGPDLQAHLHDAGLCQASRFSWERAAQETLAVYRRLADG